MKLKKQYRFMLAFWMVISLFCTAIPLSAIDKIDQNGAITLSGPWDFYWQKTHAALEANPLLVPKIDEQITLPNYWSTQGHGVEGYGTYRMHIANLEAGNYAFRLSAMLSACRIWINGQSIGSCGVFALDRASYQPGTTPSLFFFDHTGGPLIIDVEVANFDYRKGGLFDPPVITSARSANQDSQARSAVDLLLAGGLLIIALYHIGLWLFRPKETVPLWFALFCLAVLIRLLVTGEFALRLLIPDFSWELGKKMEFLIFNLGAIPMMRYLSTIFPQQRINWAEKAIVILAIPFTLAVLFLPVRISNNLVFYMQIYIILVFAYYLIVLFWALRAKANGAIYFLIGTIALFIGAGNDILYASQLIQSVYVLPQALFIFMALQSWLLARNYHAAFEQVENLSQNLELNNQALERFVPKEFFALLGRKNVREIMIGDQVEKAMSVMFTDLRGFTSLSEHMSTSEVFRFLNSFIGRVGAVIRKHGGFIDKYLGDGFLALFPSSADSAMQAAIAIQQEIVAYNTFRAISNYPAIELGIGLHYGRLVLGTIGEENRMDTTVISDVVNIASRLEGLTKHYGHGTIVTMSFLDCLDTVAAINWRYLGKVRVAGRKESLETVHVYDGIEQRLFTAYLESKNDFEEALAFYRNGDLQSASLAFAALRKNFPADRASETYYNRIKFLTEHGLPDDWDGVENTLK